jgi:hypothetical protein
MKNGLLVLTAALMLMAAPAGAMEHEGGDHSMMMHHQHMLMNHGLSMVLDGSNLVMLGAMNMSQGLDPLTVEHGKAMMTKGKAMIEKALSGPQMMEMHEKGMSPDKDPKMKATHDLGEAILKMVSLAEKMGGDGMEGHSMDMHHMHTLINHGLDMALDGADMAMMGGMEMAGSLDKPTVKHGSAMIANGKELIDKVLGSQAMKDMHGEGMEPGKDPMMKQTHDIAETAYKIIDLLEKMIAGM